jgi:ATP-dependent Lhr-like helicase
VQAVLASPIFETRWRWTTTLALAVPRSRNGARLPAQIQRMIAEELRAAIVPDAAACLDNIRGARELPEHPLVDQALRDCLEQAMDLPQLVVYLQRIFAGELRCVARDTPEPSVLCHEILNSAAYTFLDDAPLEERRTRAVYTRRATEARSADDLGALDPQAIARVREEAWPVAGTADELHDALLLAGFLRAEEAAPHWRMLFEQLLASGRAFDADGFWIGVERFDELNAVVPQGVAPVIPERLRRSWTPEGAVRELIRGRMEVLGPMTARRLADALGLRDTALVDGALLALEGEGKLLRGRFTPGTDALEWCDRRLLARIHRYTLNRLRAEIEPVSAADFMRFLLHWQHVAAEARLSGVEGLAGAIEQLDGFELPAGAWERDVLAARVKDYAPDFIDRLCLSGRIAWGRMAPANGPGKAPLRSSPIALMPREHAALWRSAAGADAAELGSEARAVHDALRSRGASFFHELTAATGLLRAQVERALGELAGAGRVTADSFSGLRALLAPSEKHKRRSRRRGSDVGVDTAGRWALLHGDVSRNDGERVETVARVLLRRYGVVFRALLAREARPPAWRDLAAVYRRLEARGEIRGGRFVSGFGGEQFALPDAVGRLRALRKQEKTGELLALSGADPLNLVGIVTPEARVTAIAPNRVLFRDGLAIAALEAGELRRLAVSEHDDATLKSLFWPRSRASDPDLRPLSPAARKRWLERRLRVPLPG